MIKQALSDPKFYELNLAEQLKVLRKIDENFAKLPEAEQKRVVELNKPKDSKESEKKEEVIEDAVQGKEKGREEEITVNVEVAAPVVNMDNKELNKSIDKIGNALSVSAKNQADLGMSMMEILTKLSTPKSDKDIVNALNKLSINKTDETLIAILEKLSKKRNYKATPFRGRDQLIEYIVFEEID